MTTIAYKEGVIAYDSQCTKCGLIATSNYNKRYDYDGHRFFMAGTVSDMEPFFKAMIANDDSRDFDVSGFMVDPDGKIWEVGGGGGPWKTPIIGAHAAVGSGRDFALAAMDFGKTAVDAVKYAKTRDTGTGGRVRTYKVVRP